MLGVVLQERVSHHVLKSGDHLLVAGEHCVQVVEPERACRFGVIPHAGDFRKKVLAPVLPELERLQVEGAVLAVEQVFARIHLVGADGDHMHSAVNHRASCHERTRFDRPLCDGFAVRCCRRFEEDRLSRPRCKVEHPVRLVLLPPPAVPHEPRFQRRAVTDVIAVHPDQAFGVPYVRQPDPGGQVLLIRGQDLIVSVPSRTFLVDLRHFSKVLDLLGRRADLFRQPGPSF